MKKYCFLCLTIMAFLSLIVPILAATFTTSYGPSTNRATGYGQSITPKVGAGIPDAQIPQTVYLTAFTLRNADTSITGIYNGNAYLDVYANYTDKNNPGTFMGSSTNTLNPYSAGLNAQLTWNFNNLALDKNTEYAFALSSNNVSGGIVLSRFRNDGANNYTGGHYLDNTSWDAEFSANFNYTPLPSATPTPTPATTPTPTPTGGPTVTPYYTEQILYDVSDPATYAQYRIPSLAITANGTVLVVCEARQADDQSPTDLSFIRSTDGGNTWSAPVVLAPGLSSGYAEMNPMLLAENSGSRVHLLWSRWSWGNCKYFIRTSLDNGATWGAAMEITYVLDAYKNSSHPYYFPNLSGAGMGPGHGIQLSSGTLMVPIYITTSNWTNSTVASIYSTDGGATWQAGSKVPNPSGYTQIHENMMVQLSNGYLLTNMRNPGSDYRAISKSSGVTGTWNTPYSDTTLIDPICQASIHRYDASTIMFTNCANVSSRTNFGIKISYDDCNTWPLAKEIYAGTAGYSDVYVGPSSGKTIYVLYEKPACTRIALARFNMAWVGTSPTPTPTPTPAPPGTVTASYGPSADRATGYGQSFTPNIGANRPDSEIPQTVYLSGVTLKTADTLLTGFYNGNVYLHIYANYVDKSNPGTLAGCSTNTVNPYSTGLDAYMTWNFNGLALNKSAEYTAVISSTSTTGNIVQSRFRVDGSNKYAGGHYSDNTGWDAEFSAVMTF
jgi:hypothetical protein